jgi:hypothetical protein
MVAEQRDDVERQQPNRDERRELVQIERLPASHQSVPNFRPDHETKDDVYEEHEVGTQAGGSCDVPEEMVIGEKQHQDPRVRNRAALVLLVVVEDDDDGLVVDDSCALWLVALAMRVVTVCTFETGAAADWVPLTAGSAISVAVELSGSTAVLAIATTAGKLLTVPSMGCGPHATAMKNPSVAMALPNDVAIRPILLRRLMLAIP